MELAVCSAMGSSWRWQGQGAHTTACCPLKPTSLSSSPAVVCVPFCLAEPVPPSWPKVPGVAAGGAGGQVSCMPLLFPSCTDFNASITFNHHRLGFPYIGQNQTPVTTAKPRSTSGKGLIHGVRILKAIPLVSLPLLYFGHTRTRRHHRNGQAPSGVTPVK